MAKRIQLLTGRLYEDVADEDIHCAFRLVGRSDEMELANISLIRLLWPGQAALCHQGCTALGAIATMSPIRTILSYESNLTEKFKKRCVFSE